MKKINIGYYMVYKTPYGRLTHSNIDDPHVQYARKNGTLEVIITPHPATCKNKFCEAVESKITGFDFYSTGKEVGMKIKIDNE